jgi:hypothetical protein
MIIKGRLSLSLNQILNRDDYKIYNVRPSNIILLSNHKAIYETAKK